MILRLRSKGWGLTSFGGRRVEIDKDSESGMGLESCRRYRPDELGNATKPWLRYTLERDVHGSFVATAFTEHDECPTLPESG